MCIWCNEDFKFQVIQDKEPLYSSQWLTHHGGSDFSVINLIILTLGASRESNYLLQVCGLIQMLLTGFAKTSARDLI